MLTLEIDGGELFDERTYEFVNIPKRTITLEHSLLSVSKWESKWKKPFMTASDKTFEETIDYVRCMTLEKNVDPTIYNYLTSEHIQMVNDYITDSMTASVVSDSNRPKNTGKFVTSELIYSWMFALRIPKECEKWHLNRLLMLIRIMDEQQQPKRKMKRNDVYRQNAELNRARRAKYGTSG